MVSSNSLNDAVSISVKSSFENLAFKTESINISNSFLFIIGNIDKIILEWDEEKRKRNIVERGIDFADAADVLTDPNMSLYLGW